MEKDIAPRGELPFIVRDSREKPGHGYSFIRCASCSGTEVAALPFGDYSLKEFPNLIVFERKKDIDELCNNLGVQRDRFERELQKMVDAKVLFKYIIIEDYYSSIYRQNRFSKMHPNSIFESIISLELKYGIHFIFAGNKEMAHRIVRSMLIKAWHYKKSGVL